MQRDITFISNLNIMNDHSIDGNFMESHWMKQCLCLSIYQKHAIFLDELLKIMPFTQKYFSNQ